MTGRCLAFLKAQFGPRWTEALVILAALPETSQDPERIMTAAIVQSHGDLEELSLAVDLAHLDWRDLLMNAGDLAHGSWPYTLDQLLGTHRQ